MVVGDGSKSNRNMPSLALTIEGTTISATDVDDEIIDSNTSTGFKSSTKNEDSPRHKLTTMVSEVKEDESEVSICSGASTPVHSYNNPQTPTSSPNNKFLHNGLEKDSRVSEKSDSDSISTVSSEKEMSKNVVNENDMNNANVQYRARKSDSSLRSIDRSQEYSNRRTKAENELISYKKTRKRTRKFMIDGVLVTTTTSKVIYGEDEDTG